MNRRTFLQSFATIAIPMVDPIDYSKPTVNVRGVVLTPDDLTLTDWPERAHSAGLTTIALHPTVGIVTKFIKSDSGRAFLKSCRKLKLNVEYELHAMSDLLPRSLFDRDPSLFRMNAKGERVRDANLCVSSANAVEIAAANAVTIGRTLRPTTGRYFYWGDDGEPWCRCPKCRELTDSDQALLLNNHIVKALRKVNRHAELAHLAYANTIAAPVSVRPEPGVFLEFAPIHRSYDAPYASQTGVVDRDRIDLLDANLAIFPRATAQVLEYWLDLSRFAGWRKPAPKLPWNPDVLAADLDAYGARGIRRITSFAVYLDAEYVRRFGDPPLNEYGRRLKAWTSAKKSRWL